MNNQELLELTRRFNDAMQVYLKSCESINGILPLDGYACEIGERFHTRKWHTVDGQAVDDLPFELRMLGLALLSSAWVADIFNRKARDRKSAGMLRSYFTFKRTLLELLNYVEYDVWSNPDKEAEELYIADLTKYGQSKALRRLGRLSKRPWWKFWR